MNKTEFDKAFALVTVKMEKLTREYKQLVEKVEDCKMRYRNGEDKRAILEEVSILEKQLLSLKERMKSHKEKIEALAKLTKKR